MPQHKFKIPYPKTCMITLSHDHKPTNYIATDHSQFQFRHYATYHYIYLCFIINQSLIELLQSLITCITTIDTINYTINTMREVLVMF